MKIKTHTIEFTPEDLQTIIYGLKSYIDLIIQSEVKAGQTYEQFIEYMGAEIKILDDLTDGEYITSSLGVELDDRSVRMIGNYGKNYFSYSERYKEYWKELKKYYAKNKSSK